MNNKNIYQTPTSDLKIESNHARVYAVFWVRVGASIIDTILIVLITLPLLYLIYGVEYWQSEDLSKGFWDIVISYVFPAVAAITFWIYKSATPGKMILGLKVISLGQSEKISFGQSIGRYFAYIPAGVVFGIGIFWIAFDKKKQGWHDKLAKTAVIKVR